MDAFAADVVALCTLVEEVLALSTRALLQSSLQAAEDAMSREQQVPAVVRRCEERAVKLLALEGPVARDLRQVVASIYIVEDLERMASLTVHVANAARRRHPEPVLSAELHPAFDSLAQLAAGMAATTRTLLTHPDPQAAQALERDDDAVDRLHEAIMTAVTRADWPGTSQEAVDAALVARYFERFADHCVNVGTRVIYLATGEYRD